MDEDYDESSIESPLNSEDEEKKKFEQLELEEETVPTVIRPTYTDEEIETLVGFVKGITTLYDLREEDWNEDCYKVIKEFFYEPTEITLTIFFDDDLLACMLGFPTIPVMDMTYFYREPGDIFTPKNFHDLINFGTMNGFVEGSILNILENVFAPIFFNTTSWPDSVKNDFCIQLHSFLGKLTDLHYKMQGLTVLYVPAEGLNASVDTVLKDRDLVKRLEGVAVYWTRQIRVALGDQEQVSTKELLCPKDEYDFWVYRYENLCSLNYQTQNKSIKHIVKILQASQSSYIRQFLQLSDEITVNLAEAKSNIEFLQILNGPCNDMKNVKSPCHIPTHIPKILNLFRVIWMNSSFYNTNEKITALCKAFSNQIILQCIEYIDLKIVFEEKKTRRGIAMFQECIECCLKYKEIYSLMAEAHTETSVKSWTLNYAAIFNHIDSFIQRCHDMIEVCEAMIVFGRFDETENIPKPIFAFTRGEEFERRCEIIEDDLLENIETLAKVQNIILDVQNASWYDVILRFRNNMNHIEVVIENLISTLFEYVLSIDDCLLCLSSLYNYSHREKLLPMFEKKSLVVHEMFEREIKEAKTELVKEREEYPSLLPYYSGRAMMALLKKNLLMSYKKLLDDACWLWPCTRTRDIFEQYKNLIGSIDEFVKDLNNNWIDCIGDNILRRLDRPLMCKSTKYPGLIECNIDRSIMDICREVRCWESLNMKIPHQVMALYKRYDKLKYVFEIVLVVARDYNKIIAALSEEERLMFRPLISIVEKKISPGLTKLMWNADVADDYVAECSDFTKKLQDFIDDYKLVNLQVIKICEQICATYLIKIIQHYTYDLPELASSLELNRDTAVEQIANYYKEIIIYLVVVQDGLQPYMNMMSYHWKKYVEKFDNLLEMSLKICVKASLNKIYEAMHGDGTTQPSPLLKVDVNLLQNQMNFAPPVSEVGSVFSSILPGIISSLENIPRLFVKFDLQGKPPLPFHEVISRDEDCNELQYLIKEEVKINVKEIQVYKKIWDPFVEIWQIDKDRFMKRYELQKPQADSFDSNIGRYTEVATDVALQETITTVHFVSVNANMLKNSIIDHCIQWQERLKELLKEMTIQKINHIYEYTKENTEKVSHIPKTIAEMQVAIKLLNCLMEEVPVEEHEFPMINERFRVLNKYDVEIDDTTLELRANIEVTWNKYLESLAEADIVLNKTKDYFRTQLLNDAENLRKEADNLLHEFLSTAPFSFDWKTKDALAYLSNMQASLKKMKDEQKRLKEALAIFNISQPDSLDLQKLETELNSLELVWQLTDQWDEAWDKYRCGEFWEIETEEMDATAQTLFRKLNRLARELKEKNWTIVNHTRQRVDAFRRTMPLIIDLKNPSMRDRHWDLVKKTIKRDFDQNSPEFNLETIIEYEFQLYAEEINDISNAATMELQIEIGLKNIEEIWKNMQIEIVPHKFAGIYRVKSVDDCFAAIEDNLLQLSGMKSTRFVKPFVAQVDYWERVISYIMETLEQALFVQRQYLYLENIFIGEDIRKQLPKETSQFDVIVEEWKRITTNMYNSESAYDCTHFKPPPYLLNALLAMSDDLEVILRALEQYLETKRHVFPRFYFISNDDLLEILGNSKKPEMVQPHLKKLFDNLNKLKINKHAFFNKQIASGMFSDDGEYIEFVEPVILEGAIELWLRLIEKSMRNVLYEQLKQCRLMLRKMLKKRDKWLLTYPGQLCNTTSQIQWTTDCTRALLHCKIMEVKKPLKKLRKKQNQVLLKLSELSRKDLEKMQRLKTNALITIEIHARDVIDNMYRRNCMDITSFEWFSQLRFYWDRDIDNCVIHQTNTTFIYGYEYTGNSGRLVITPLTDRCYITLTTALHLHRGGSPKGPAGTGKTETVKDLGKALGMWVIVNNCSEGLDYKSMGKMFSGLAQTGCWGCFDEFNRINIEVLSVVAQQILSILSALAAKLSRFLFEGLEIDLVPTCGIFITMNPGYAGRTELPDNLKSMFRPISMIVPDSVIIAENTLFSDGFRNTRVLAKKVFTLYSLATQQLSKQDHYDFGLRSMVALLRYAGRKRRAHPNLPEEQMVYLAMRDMNIAKLTSDDLPLFNGIMSDIFPGIETPIIDYEDMIAAITTELKTLGMQPIPAAIKKCIQLYETKTSRHSVMILGKTCTAKSTTWKGLKGALGRLKTNGKEGFNEVKVFPINPKALSLGELYGEYNLSTNEWLDGVLSSVMRKTCSDESRDEKWILFDGPVDAVWIENMNSVMDDNKILTLINSERITMPEQVSLLFEVGDLSVASPATVSRCGMVYNDYKDWGWRPYVTSWLQKQTVPEYQSELQKLFDRYLSNILEFKRLKCKEIIQTVELNNVMALCRLLECFVKKENGIEPKELEIFPTLMKFWFLFCIIWSICATVDEDGRKKIDNLIREMENMFPLKDTVYEYFIDTRVQTLVPWEGRLSDSWRYNSDWPFYKIIVPTVDTIRYEYIVSALLANNNPVLMTGPVGTGKTSTAFSVTRSLDPATYSILSVNLSAQTTSNNLQDFIESRLEKRTKNVFVPVGGKKLLAFLDELNMPAKDTYGSQPPLELLKQWIDYGFWYDRKNQKIKNVQNMLLLSAMGPPGGGRTIISDRLLSRFSLINMTFPTESQIIRIFGTMLNQHLSEFHEETKITGRILTTSTIELYNNIVAKMLPTPAKIHYLFNLRDISKIFQGLLRSNKEYQNTKETFLRLWIHECFRVFYDRLIDEKDREWFLNSVSEQLGKQFELTFHSLCPGKECPLFGDFVNPFNIYEELLDHVALRKYIELQLDEYNVSPGCLRMDLVLFKDAIEHICRIVRVISQPRGNMQLIGIGGSGRQSLARIAAYICEYQTYQIEVTKNYKVPEFREDLKVLYKMTGVEYKATSFLFNDTQISDESFLEIVNNMLSSGEVANLYKADEFEDIKNNLSNAATKAGVVPTTEGMYSFFIERVRTNLHIVLCMSPVGDAFRNRLRQYPALVNCTTIDWFSEWPKQALLEVAIKFLADVNFVMSITGNVKEKRRESLVRTTQDRLREDVANIFALIHYSVASCSRQMLVELKRYNYVTPTNYLELVRGYKKMLDEKRQTIALNANKLRNGLSKIDETRAKVEILSLELEEAKTKIAEFTVQLDQVLIVIKNQTKEADEQQRSVAARSAKIEVEEVACKKLADAAQADLAQAMPALEEAIRALDSLNKKDITEVRSYGRPPAKVEMVMEAVMIMKQVEPTWAEAKRQLGDQNFLTGLREFDKDHISDRTLKKIAVYTTNEDFEPEKVGIVSLAAKSLCMWVRAIEKYGKIYRVVAPKKAKFDEAMASLNEKQAMLAEAKAKLREISERLERLQEEYNEKLKEKEELQRKAEELLAKLERAGILIENLSSEKDRWEATVKRLDSEFLCLPGDCLLATAFVSYLGPFVSKYREILVKEWTEEVVERDVPCSEIFSVVDFLCDPTTIREWNIQGLPSDSFSTENGIIVVRGSRWPLIIDPQCQAMKWIKNMEGPNELKIIDFGMPDYMKIMEQAVQFGKPILLQNVMEILDPSLAPILNKNIIKQQGQLAIKLNDKVMDYNPNFRFFITTKLSNPHYAPEVSTKTTLVNFAVKEEGLEAQLLGIVVRKEKPQLEEQKDNLVLTIAKGKRTLMDLEDELLRLLYETKGSLLDDANLFNTLQVSKATSIDVKESLAISETTEIEIDAAREGYRPCSKRAAILFFVLNDMSSIDPMYRFSLDAYIRLFLSSIEKSRKSSDLDERIEFLNEFHTYAVYKNTCRGLFESHKLLFSFLMCVKILDALGKIIAIEYDFLLKGGVVLDREGQMDNPCTSWLTDVAWDNITELDKLPGFHGVLDTFEQFPRDWYTWYTNTEPETCQLIGEWEGICSEFQRMLFVRSLRPDRITVCITNFIINTLGPKFVEPPVLDMKAVLEESIAQTPLIFVLSPGVDPTTALIQLAETSDMTANFRTLSLGQGQAPYATRMLHNGTRDGHWVFLANCHLSLSWMPDLDKIVDTLQTAQVHPEFRLWLSSSPHPDFPISILQASIKMTTEPPKGIKANLKRLYNLLTEEQFSLCQAKEKYKKLVFSLCFFHAILLERKKFQQLGWNVIYGFNDSDFEVSENLLQIYLDEYPVTPFDALKYLIAGVNYGGHVTDDWDRRLLITYINQYFNEDVLSVAHYRLSSLPTYYIPKDGSLQSYRDYITILPNMDRPEAFGQHSNADITSLMTETQILFETLMSLQVQGSSAGQSESTEEKVSQLAHDVLTKIPDPINYENTEKLIGANKQPLDVVLLQEIARYNVLLVNIRSSLIELQKGIKGFIVMSSDLEEIFTCIYEGRVPSMWLKAYPSLKLLGSWTRDLVLRIEHFSTWAETTHPPLLFWLAAYTFPTGFLTAVLQTAARAQELPIDTLSWEFSVYTLEDNTVVEPPPVGVYVRGMFLEGAAWNKRKACLIEPKPMELVCPMPLILFKPCENLKKKTKGLYVCPCYYYPIRTGMQGRPAYVVAVDLNSGTENSDFWIKRGTALLLSLPN